MTDLSPAAQAVLDAVLATYPDNIPKDDNLWALERASTAAALRAVADHVVPLPRLPYDSCCDVSASAIRAEILAIAAELEANA